MLADCYECDKEISTTASRCPHCGYNYNYDIDTWAADWKMTYGVIKKADGSGQRRMSEQEIIIFFENYNKAKEEERLKKEKESNSGCFIATAAYGTLLANEVSLLRQFRDERLIHYRAGRVFIASYYRLSPPIAGIIKQSRILRAITRAVLRPVIWFLRK